MRRLFAALSLIALAQCSEPLYAADKPLVLESGQIKPIPAATDLQLTQSVILPHISAPGSPVNGQCWTQTTGLFCRINGATVGPMGTATAVGGAYTVATLPTAGTIGRIAYVTDATSPTYLGTLTGGGSVKTPVFDNGTAWVSF